MNSKGVIEGLKANYPAGLHPSEQQTRDMLRTMKALKYGPVELQKLYDELLRRCEFFPKVADIISCAGNIALPLRPKTKDRMFETYEDDSGRVWARSIGFAEYESGEDREKRWMGDKSAMSWEEGGRENWLNGFYLAGGDVSRLDLSKGIPVAGLLSNRSSTTVVEQINGVSNQDTVEIEWQFEGEEGSSIDDL